MREKMPSQAWIQIQIFKELDSKKKKKKTYAMLDITTKCTTYYI